MWSTAGPAETLRTQESTACLLNLALIHLSFSIFQRICIKPQLFQQAKQLEYQSSASTYFLDCGSSWNQRLGRARTHISPVPRNRTRQTWGICRRKTWYRPTRYPLCSSTPGAPRTRLSNHQLSSYAPVDKSKIRSGWKFANQLLLMWSGLRAASFAYFLLARHTKDKI